MIYKIFAGVRQYTACSIRRQVIQAIQRRESMCHLSDARRGNVVCLGVASPRATRVPKTWDVIL